jgi:hypothetical protein
VSSEKDDPQLQQARLERLAKEVEPGCEVYFDLDQPPHLMRMRADHAKTGVILIVSPGYWHFSQTTDNADDELKLLLNAWRAVRPW